MSLAKCLIEIPLEPEDIAHMSDAVKRGLDPERAIEALRATLDNDLADVRKQLTEKGHAVSWSAPSNDVASSGQPILPEFARDIAEAKEEGFDPITGAHDLETDIEVMRAQGLLDTDSEKALAAADETFGMADAWGNAMAVIQNCVIKS